MGRIKADHDTVDRLFFRYKGLSSRAVESFGFGGDVLGAARLVCRRLPSDLSFSANSARPHGFGCARSRLVVLRAPWESRRTASNPGDAPVD